MISPVAKIIILAVLLLVPVNVSALGEEIGKRWSIEPAANTGAVYEFLNDASLYTGGKITVRYSTEKIVLKGRYSLDDYQMTYYATPKESVNYLITTGVPTGPLLEKVRVAERKEDICMLLGHIFYKRLHIMAGGRQITLTNNFSSMSVSGPALDVEGSWKPGNMEIKIGVDGLLGTSNSVENHRTEYVVYDGVKTASFYGVPWYSVGWRASIRNTNRKWWPALGYEGTLITFKHTYRYYHGLALSAVF